MNRTISKNSARKAKRSFTLSADSVAFLEAMRKRRRAASTSSVLEEILQTARRDQHRISLEQATAAYYSSLSPTEAKEQSEWGEFATREFSSGTA